VIANTLDGAGTRGLLGPHRRHALRPSTAVALIDFDNWYRATPSASIDAVLPHCINEVTRELVELADEASYVLLRIYGGWFERGVLTAIGSDVAAASAAADPFPLAIGNPRRIVHGELQLVRHLSIAPHIELGDTFRRRGGPPRLRLNGSPLPQGCLEALDSCPARILQKFTKGPTRSCPVDSCPVTAETAFLTREQKMVDTMMTCDLLDYMTDSDVIAIAVVTADSDLLPPLVHARSLNGGRLLLATNLPYWNADQISLVRSCGIEYRGPEPA
jgi:hypothetical protein